MDITPLMRPEQKIIQSYGAGFFRVNGDILKHPILVMDETVIEWRCGHDLFDVSDEILALKGSVDILLIGAGRHSPVLSRAERLRFQELGAAVGIRVDVMDTPAACRTYNVLTAEGRRIAAALYPV